MIQGLPVNQNSVGAVGALNATPISVSGIRTSDILLYVAAYKPGSAVLGLDCSDFVVSDGAITAAGVDTTDYFVFVGWSRP